MPLLQKNKRIIIASAIFLALAFSLEAWIKESRFKSQESINLFEPQDLKSSEPLHRHPLTGLPALSQRPSDGLMPPGLPVYAVMIDNAVDAWPVSGIDKAFLVIEAPVEAAIPRLEAFFSSDTVVLKIGPVRSARPYFIDWANEFDALYTHVGGSNAALEVISSTGTFDINEFWNGDYFWRASDRYAPHNTYTSTELLGKYVEAAIDRDRAPEVLYGVWNFKDIQAEPSIGSPQESSDTNKYSLSDPAVAGESKGQSSFVTVYFNSDLYTANWTYDSESGQYIRSQGGRPYLTADGTQVTATNVAVIVTDIEILDYVGRREIRTVGEGKAWLAQDGITIEATWKKPSTSERLRFFDMTGNEITMNAGNTWIEVVGDEEDVTVGIKSL